MKYRTIKKLGLKASIIGQGTGQFGTYAWGYGSQFGDSDIANIISTCFDVGINVFDTSETYGDTRSETILGTNLKEYPRDDYLIISKVAPWNLRYNNVLKSCNSSLNRLGTNFIDIYMIHYPNPLIPLKETVRSLELLMKKGLISSIGVSNFNKHLIQHMNKLLKKEEIVANEIQYNLFSRRPEIELIPWCKKQNIEIIAYSPLCGGLLTQPYSHITLPKDRARAFNFYSKSNFYWNNENLVNKISDLSFKYNCSMSQIALNYLIMKNVFSIPASLSSRQVVQNSDSCEVNLSPTDQKAIQEFYHPLSMFYIIFDHGVIRPISWIKEGLRQTFRQQ